MRAKWTEVVFRERVVTRGRRCSQLQGAQGPQLRGEIRVQEKGLASNVLMWGCFRRGGVTGIVA